MHGPTINCVWNASRWKAEKWCFQARLSIQRLVHCSVISVAWYTVHWTVEHASTVHWTVEHVNSARIALFTWNFFFFQCVNFFNILKKNKKEFHVNSAILALFTCSTVQWTVEAWYIVQWTVYHGWISRAIKAAFFCFLSSCVSHVIYCGTMHSKQLFFVNQTFASCVFEKTQPLTRSQTGSQDDRYMN